MLKNRIQILTSKSEHITYVVRDNIAKICFDYKQTLRSILEGT